MTSVDTRVVQMHFDNAQFEKGVKKSIESLRNLDESLELKNGAKGLLGLTSALGKVRFDSIESGLDSFRSKASSVFNDVKDLASGLVKTLTVAGAGLSAAAIGQMSIGGWRRAANLEQAKFQLEGLGVAYEKINDALEYATVGTPYGMDAAAKAAAQLVASGVSIETYADSFGNTLSDMHSALRGISGVAAMTNSSFEEISNIFTKVAGNGRLMADELNSIGGRGLNAAAALATYLGVSESEVRDMTSKGEIDFMTFAAAMDDAFGEHAKEANSTFDGALANMKASLSRIGADFITPIRELGRRTFLGITQVTNNIRSGLRRIGTIVHAEGSSLIGGGAGAAGEWSIVSSFEYNMNRLGEIIDTALTKFGESDILGRLIGNMLYPADAIFHGTMLNGSVLVEEIFTRLSKIPIDSITGVFDSLGQHMYVFSDWTAKNIPTIFSIFDSLFQLFNTFALSPIGDVLGAIFKGFYNAVQGPAGSALTSIEQGLSRINKVLYDFSVKTRNIKIPQEVINGIQSIAEALFTFAGTTLDKIPVILGGIMPYVENFVEFFGGMALNALSVGIPAITNWLNDFWPVLESIGNVLSSIFGPASTIAAEAVQLLVEKVGGLVGIMPDLSSELPTLEDISNKLNDIADRITETFGKAHLSDIIGFFQSIADGSFDLNAALENLKTKFEEFKATVIDLATKAFSKLEEKLPGVAQALKDLWEIIKPLFETGKEYLDQFFGSGNGNSIEGRFGGLKQVLSNNVFGSLGRDSSEAAEGLGLFNTQATTFLDIFGTFGDKLSNFADSFGLKDVAVILSSLVIGGVFKGLKEFHKTLDNIATSFTSLGSALSTVAGTIAGFIQLPLTIGNAISSYYKALAEIEKAKSITAMIKDVAIAVALLAASMWLLSTIPQDKILQAGASLGAIFAGVLILLFGIVTLLKKIDPKVLAGMYPSIMALSVAMLAVAVAIGILTGSVMALSNVHWTKLIAGTASVCVMMIALGVTMRLIAGLSGSIIQAAGAMLLLGLALIPLTAAVMAFASVPLDPEHYTRLFIALTIVIGMMALFAGITNFMNPAKLASAGAGILAMSSAMLMLAVAAAAFGALPLGVLIKGVGAIGVLFVAIGVLAKLATGSAPAILAAGAAMMLMAPAILAMAAAIGILTTIAANITNGPGMMKQSVIALAGLAVAMMAVIAVLSIFPAPNVLAAAAAILVLSGAMVIMAAAIGLLSLVPSESLWPAVGAIAALAAVCTVAGAVLSVFSVGLLLVGAATLMFGAGVWLASTGLAAFAASIVALGAMGPAAFKMIGLGLQTLAQEASIAAQIFAVGIATAINMFVKTLQESAPEVEGASGTLIDAFVAGANSRLPQIAFFAAGAITAFLQGIAMQAFAIGQAGLQIVAYLVLGVASGVGLLIEAAMVLAAEFIIGLARGIQNNGEMIYNAVSGLTGMIFAAFENLIADLIDSIIGPNPIADAIRENAAGLEAAANESLGAAEAAADEKMNSMKEAAGEAMGDIANTMNEPVDGTEGGEASSQSWIEGFTGPIKDMLPAELQGVFSGDAFGDMSQFAMPEGENWAQGWGEGATSILDGEVSGEVVTSVEGIMSEAESVDSESAGSTVGYNFGAGLAAGIASSSDAVIRAVDSLIEAAVAEAEAKAAISSPSKVMKKRGVWFAQGFAVGIVDAIGFVANAAARMTETANAQVSGFTNVVADSLTGIDWDSQPVIRPVLDLSNVQEGANRLNSLIADNNIMQAGYAGRYLGGYTLPGSTSNDLSRHANNYEFNLNYGAGTTPNEMVIGIANIIKSKNLMGG